MENIIDFINAALPWIAIGLLLAVFFARSSRKKKNDEKYEDYGSEGMCIGMSLGVALGSSFASNVGMGMTLGMLIGLVIGSCIKKDDDDSRNDANRE